MDLILSVLVLSGALYRWIEPVSFDTLNENLISSALLVCSGCCIIVWGACVEKVRRWFQHPYEDLQIPWGLTLLTGQLALILYLYIRSLLSEVIREIGGVSLGVTSIELWILTGIGIFVIARAQIFSSRLLRAILALFALSLFICLRECPRDTPLSTDPDRHAYWAYRIITDGVIPWFEGSHSVDGGFFYPAGFASLNGMWVLLSGGTLSPVLIVTVQPMLQVLIALLSIGTLVTGTNISTQKKRWSSLVSSFPLIIYLWLAPWGYDPPHYWGEGTARLSSLLFLLPLLLIRLKFFCELMWWQEGVLWGVLGLFNPVLWLGCLLLFIVPTFMTRVRWRYLVFCNFIRSLTLSICLMLLDPYYLFCVVMGKHPSLLSPHASFTPFTFEGVFSSLAKGEMSSEFLSGGFYTITSQIVLFCFPLLILILFLRELRSAFRFIAVVLVMTGIIGVFELGTSFLPHYDHVYLFVPYLHGIAVSVGYLVIPLLVTYAASRFQSTLPIVVYLFVLVSLVVTTVWSYPLPRYRQALQPPQGAVTNDDRAVISALTVKHSQLRSSYGDLPYQQAPKILVVSTPALIGEEQWLLPSGGARILPLFDVPPVAFWYYQGNPRFWYDEYRSHVCNHFDRSWLMKNNIRYVFVPSDRGAACVRGGIEHLAVRFPVILKSGNSFAVEIPRDG